MTDKEIEKLEKELEQKIASGEATDEDIYEAAKKYGDSSDVAKARFDELVMKYATSEAGMGFMERAKLDTEKGRVQPKVLAGLQTALGLFDATQSGRQIRESDRQLRGMRRPQLPAIPLPDELLNQQIGQAQRDTEGVAAATMPFRQQALDTYGADLAQARTASGGQAGIYGALGQGAANRRYRANMDLLPIQEGIRQNNRGRLDNLMGMRMQQGNQDFRNRMWRGQLDLNQYNMEQQMYGQLGAMGRSNMSRAVGDIALGMEPWLTHTAAKRSMPRTNREVVDDGIDNLIKRSSASYNSFPKSRLT